MFKTLPDPAYAQVSSTKLTNSTIFLEGSILITSNDVSTKLYCPKKSRPSPSANILVKLCSKSFSSFSSNIYVMHSAAS